MKTKGLCAFLLVLMMIAATVPAVAHAETYTIEDMYLTVELPDGVTVLTPDTPSYDESWKKAGITDVSKELETYEDMGVQAVFVPGDRSGNVTLMRKDSDENMEQFNFLSMTEAEFEKYVDGMLEADAELEEAQSEKTEEELAEEAEMESKFDTTASSYRQEQTPFFRIEVKSTDETEKIHEIIYGTIMNGYSVSFDIYSGSGYIDEDSTIIRQLVDSARFTKVFTKEEVEQETQAQVKSFLIQLAIFVVIIAGAVIFFKVRSRHNKKLEKLRKDEITAYRIRKKQQEDSGIVIHEEAAFVNETLYDDDVLKDFAIFNVYLKSPLRIFSGLILSVAVLIFVYFNSSSIWIPLILLALIIAYAYYLGIMGEKQKEKLIKKYKAGKSRTAVTKFYEEHFTVTGIQYYTDYPYFQITEARKSKKFVYLYNGPEIAYYVSLESFTQGDAERFLDFLKQKLGAKFR